MTTATPTEIANTKPADVLSATPSQSETMLTDMEVLRRAYAIRSTWSITERIHRRREANERFSNLLDALALPQEAA